MADGNFPTYATEATTVLWIGGYGATVRLAGAFVNFAGGFAAGVGFLGVQSQDLAANTPAGTPIAVEIEGIVQVNSGAAIALGAPLTCLVATGEFIPAVTGNDIHGRAMSAATAAGQRMLMKITREGKA